MTTKKVIIKEMRLIDLVDKVINLASQGAKRCPKSVPRLTKGFVKSVTMDVPVGADTELQVSREDVYGATVLIKSAGTTKFIDKIIDVASNGGIRSLGHACTNKMVCMVVPKAQEKEPYTVVQNAAVDAYGKVIKSEEVTEDEEKQEVTQEVSEEVSETGTQEDEQPQEPEEEVTTEVVEEETSTQEEVPEYVWVDEPPTDTEEEAELTTPYYTEEELKDKPVEELKEICKQLGVPSRRSRKDCIKEILNV